MRGGKKITFSFDLEEKKKLFWLTEDGGCWVR